jgi:O-antigen/teichoic acid export membrane protein
MGQLQEVAHNTIFQITGKIFFLAVMLAITWVLTQYLGPSLYGFYVLINVYLAVATRFYDFGVSSIGSREMAKSPERTQELLGGVFSLRLLLAFLTAGLIIGFAFLFYQGEKFEILRNGILISSVTIILNNLTSSWLAVFLARLKMGYGVVAEGLSRIVVLIGVVLAMYLNWSFLAIIGLGVLGNLVYLIIVHMYAARLFHIRVNLSTRLWPKLWRDSWPLGLYLVVSLMLFHADIVMISLMRSTVELGQYAAAYKLLEIALSFGVFFSASVYPVIAHRLQMDDLAGIVRALQRSLSFILAISIPMVLFIIYLANEIILLVSGSEFLGAIPVLKVLSVAVGFGFFNGLFGYMLTAKNYQRTSLLIAAFGLSLNIVLNFILIPQYGIIAAAYTTLVASIIEFIFMGYFMFKIYNFAPQLGLNTRTAIAGAILGLALYYFQFEGEPWYKLIFVATAGLAYGLILLIVNKEFRAILAIVFGKTVRDTR